MSYHFYLNNCFIGRFKHLNEHRLQKEPVKIGKFYYEVIEIKKLDKIEYCNDMFVVEVREIKFTTPEDIPEKVYII